MGDQSSCSMPQIMVMCSMTVLARGAREIFSTLRYIRALWIRANNALADGRKLDCIRPCQALLIIFALVLIGGCESDREELESSNSCVWCRLNDANLAGADLAGATLWMAFLERADLSEANLSGANINRATLTAADLTGTNLAEATLGNEPSETEASPTCSSKE